jgi:hypothetical protein
MPSRTLLAGKRYNPLTMKLWRAFKRDRQIDIPFEDFKNIIWTTNQLMAEGISEEEAGIELYERLGNIVVTKYKNTNKKKIPIDWVNSKRLGRRIPLLNLHSFGYMVHIKWFKMVCLFKNRRIYRFVPYRVVARAVAANVKKGKRYHSWDDSDFWSTTRLQRRFSKFYKQE